MKVDAKNLKRTKTRLMKTARAIKKGSRQSTHNVGLAGKNYARAIAPIQTGSLINAIMFRSPKANEALIVSQQPKHPTTPNVPYHAMMHGLIAPDISHKIYSGDPHYMFRMYDWLAKRFPKQMEDMVRTAIKTGDARISIMAGATITTR